MAVELGAVADLPTKYQKLASEYSKIRAQVIVLKKAVFDEQSKVADLKEALKARDHTVRKNEQEMESLEFRNQQLSRRVSVLQEELNSMQQHKGHSKNKAKSDSVQSQLANNILGEELQQKIEENARLHQQVYETDFVHQKELTALQERLKELERDVKGHDSVVQQINDRNKALIDKLQQDKLLFEVKLQSAEKEAKEANIKTANLQEKLLATEQSLSLQLERANSLIQSHLPFVDTRLSSVNCINVPRSSGRSGERCSELVKKVADVVREVVQHLSNCHTYLEQRALICNSQETAYVTSAVTKQLADYLHENRSYLKQLENSYQAFESSLRSDVFIAVETTPAFQHFFSQLTRYVAYLKKIFPYLTLSLEEENVLSWCPVELKQKNESIIDGWFQLITALSKLCTYTQLLMSIHSATASCTAVETLVAAVGQLFNSTKIICTQYNAKVLILKDLPVISDKLKTTDECVVSSLVALVATLKKLYNVLSESMDGILNEQKNRPSVALCKAKTNLLVNYKKRAVNYMSSIHEGPNEFIPYAEAIKNRNVLRNSMESKESLISQLSEAEEKISKLEQLKEYWMLEYQLLRMKQEKLQKKLQLDSDNVSLASEKTLSPSKDSTPFISTSMLAKLEFECSNERVCECCKESEDIRQYFVRRINDVVAGRQLADSKAIALHSELVGMQRRLLLAEKSKSEVVDQLLATNETVNKLKEELLTTTNNYKTQLSTMSEHLANMNDKLTAQTDEIDDLKYALNNAGLRKSKGK